jgi:hypothetical protein
VKNISSHWYQIPIVIAGNTAIFRITDGGLGDDDQLATALLLIPVAAAWVAAQRLFRCCPNGLLALAGLMVLLRMGA